MTNLSSSIVNSLYNIQLMNLAGENGVAAFGTIMYVNFILLQFFWDIPSEVRRLSAITTERATMTN